jgi:hypothetical protein
MKDTLLVAHPTFLEKDRLSRWGALAAFLLILYSIEMMIQLVVLGGYPATAEEAFRLLHQSAIRGLLRLDLPTAFAMPLYYVLFLSLYEVLKKTDRVVARLGTVFVFVGVTLFLTTPSALSMLALKEKFVAATTEAARLQFLAAGEAVLATDMWHGTCGLLSGILIQSGALLISLVMVRSCVFSRTIGYLGILACGLDLAHILAGFMLPKTAVVLMAIAGPLYPIWFLLVGRRLYLVRDYFENRTTIQ